jgi:glycosyltransferase 2 family protein
MRTFLTSVPTFIRDRVGWNKLGFLASVVVLCLAGFTLFRMLRDVQPERVLSSIAAMPASNIAISIAFVAAAYFTITFYDFFALRTIGARHVPYRVAAMSAFTSFSIGHNLGATVFTGGAIRFRIYSAYGLSIIDVAKIAFVTGLTFWLGNAFVLGLGMAAAPEAASALDQLPPWVNRAIGLTGLAAICVYLLWLVGKTRVIGVKGVTLTLPSARLTFVQILIGIADLGLAAIGMYVLLPANPPMELLPFVVIFVLATLLGFLSHTPGAIGVFDAAILIALVQYPKEELLATLLIWRAIYYILPFSLALLVMATREFCLAYRRPAGRGPVYETPRLSGGGSQQRQSAQDPAA